MASKRLLLPMFVVAGLGVGAVVWLQTRPFAAPPGRHEAEPAMKSAETGDADAEQTPPQPKEMSADGFLLLGGEATAAGRVLEVGQPLEIGVEWTAGERTCFDKGKTRLCVDAPAVFQLQKGDAIRLSKGLAHFSVDAGPASIAVDEATGSCQQCEFEFAIEGEGERRVVTIKAIRGTLALVDADGTSRTMEKGTEVELGPAARTTK